MKRSLLTLCTLLWFALASQAQTARVQIIHNSPDPTVDVYVNGAIALDDFIFRSATGFLDLPAGIPLSVAVAPGSSSSVAEAIATFPVTFESGKTYAVTASGIVGSTTTPFTLIADAAALETATASNKVSLNVLHGSPDAPAVDVAVRTGAKVISNLAYGQFTPYLALDPGVYYLDVKPAGSPSIVATFKADLTGLAGQAVRVLASGLLTGTPGFGLFAVLADGTVVELPNTPVARVQILHASPDPTVDIYANGGLLVDNLAYLNATPFVYVPAETPLNIGIALSTSTSASDTLVNFPLTLENGKTYIVAATGIVGNSQTPFNLTINSDARETAANADKVDFAVLHAAPNVGQVNADELYTGDRLVSNLDFRQFTPYLSVDPAKYDIGLQPTGTPGYAAEYRADLSALKGAALYVFAAALPNQTPGFGLFALTAGGQVLQLGATPRAEVQVVHNSPSPTVDVYLGPVLLIDNFKYRTATPYVSIIADRALNVGIAPENSSSAANAIANFPANFVAGELYTVFASGLVGETPAFTLNVNEAKKTAAAPGTVELSAYHGAPDAPNVDIAVVGLGNVITNLGFGEFTDYLAVPPGTYQLQVKPAGTNTVVATFTADLTGLTGRAVRVYADGFLGKQPLFGLFALLEDGTIIELPRVPVFARVQIIHNSPSPTVDVYADNNLLIDNFQFRSATSFINVPANVPITIGVAPENSTSAAQAIATFPVTFAEGKTYVVTASGIVGNAATPFTLIVNDAGREIAAQPGKVSVAIQHGAPNAPAVDVFELFSGLVTGNLAYGQFTPYLDLDPAIYDFGIRAAGTSTSVGVYRADLRPLGGAAAYVFASGLLNGTPGFGLFAALSNGTVIQLPVTPLSRVQIIHNSPSPTVDVYANSSRILNDFQFRTATPFLSLPADRNFRILVAPGTSQSVADSLIGFPVNFASGKTYTVIANGIVGNATTPFTLAVNDQAVETAAAGVVAVSAFHGSPGAPAVDISERLAGPLFSNLAYNNYTPYISLDAGTYYIDVRATGTDPIVGTYLADLSALGGSAARIFASGILNGTPAFGLFAALPTGQVVTLPLRPVARVQILHNAPEPTVDVYAFTQLILDDFEFRSATPFVYLPAGITIPISVAPSTSTSVAQAIATFNASFENGKTYYVVASGLVGGTPGFNLLVREGARERATDPTKLELAALHGIPDAPTINVQDWFSGANLITDLQYGQFTDYLTIDPDVLIVRAVPSATPTQTIGIWGADLTGGEDISGLIFASGRVSDNSYDLWVALPNGLTFPLFGLAEAQIIHNAIGAPTVDVYLDGEEFLPDFGFRDATPYVLLVGGDTSTIAIAPPNSTSSAQAIYTANLVAQRGKTYTIMAGGVVGGSPAFDLFVNENTRRFALNPNNAEVNLFHGSPDAPEVDVIALGGPVLFDNIQFGEYANYISVPAAEYKIAVTPSGNNSQIVQSYTADLQGLAGQSLTVFASGRLSGTPGFEVWVALEDGTTFPLPTFVSVNELDNKLADLTAAPNPTFGYLNLSFSLTETEALRFRLRDLSGRLVQEGDLGTLSPGNYNQSFDLSGKPNGMYLLELMSDGGIRSVKVIKQ